MRPAVQLRVLLRRAGSALRPLVVPPGLTPAAAVGFVACALVLGVIAGTFVRSADPAPSGASAALAAALGRPGTPAAATVAKADADAESDADATDDAASDDGATTDDASSDDDATADAAGDSSSDTTSTSDDPSTDDDTTTDDDAETDPAPASAAAPIHHLWIVSVSGRAAAPQLTGRSGYLGSDLAAQGTVLTGYAPGTSSVVAATTALLSGQTPTAAAQAGCATFTDVPDAPLAADGTIAGDGCVYPSSVPTLPDRVVAAARTWRGYVAEPTACRRPAAGTADPWRTPTAADPYVTARNPFVWFHGLTDGTACGEDVVGTDRLAGDLTDAAKAPTVSWVVPDATGSGQGVTGADAGDPAGLETFLRATVPAILDSKAYRDGGAVLVVPDAGSPVAAGAATGALLISAKTKAGGRLDTPAGPPVLLRTIADLVGATAPGTAAAKTTTSLAEPLTDVVAPGTAGSGDRDL